ncbi:uncharacterized protein LOC111391466 [Olea europaea var. sylvestris]|uniref:uncharacterized protein LOC111391466 n=1 Tax=Olea europaea var. sylvestris TaxID=158386 RepID=UPI000C1CE605|nr:uncharacterized protein LOC111391466 [Olea europaea var. sylvestris]
MKVVNQIRLLGDDLLDKRVVEKFLIIQASYRVKKHQSEKKKVEGNKNAGKIDGYPPCPHCSKWCWYRPGVQCRACKQFENVQKVCKNLKEKQPQQHAQAAENLQQDQQGEHLFTATNHKMYSDIGTWLLDSGCTHHMASDSSIFVELDNTYKSKVKMGNGENVKVEEIGVIAVQTPIGQLVEKNYTLIIKDSGCTILDGNGNELMTVEMKQRSFPLERKRMTSHTFSSTIVESSLWHKRFGNANFTSLKQLNKQELC